MPHPDDASEPVGPDDLRRCENCEGHGCKICDHKGWWVMDRKEIEQLRAEMRRPERA